MIFYYGAFGFNFALKCFVLLKIIKMKENSSLILLKSKDLTAMEA